MNQCSVTGIDCLNSAAESPGSQGACDLRKVGERVSTSSTDTNAARRDESACTLPEGLTGTHFAPDGGQLNHGEIVGERLFPTDE